MRNRFIRFLKDNGIGEEYRIESKVKVTLEELVENMLGYTIPENLIVCAFHWQDTQQGDRYWDKLNEYWIEELNNARL